MYVCMYVFFLTKSPVEKISSEYRFGTLFSQAAAMLTNNDAIDTLMRKRARSRYALTRLRT